MFIYLIIILKLVFVVKFCWLLMVKGIVYVIFFSVINEMFNFCIDNVVAKPIINKCFLF